ncbi:MAG: hypothetical protein K9N38_09790 [Candidatus Marinimicrobia bacterium]|nr:hypothetical protein [Candidatus Neomarinimicrobiota bacterium]
MPLKSKLVKSITILTIVLFCFAPNTIKAQDQIGLVNLSYLSPGLYDIGVYLGNFEDYGQQYYFTFDQSFLLGIVREIGTDWHLDSAFTDVGKFKSAPILAGRTGVMWGSDELAFGVGLNAGIDIMATKPDHQGMGYFGAEIPVKYVPMDDVTLLFLPFYQTLSAKEGIESATRIGLDIMPFYAAYDPFVISAQIGFNSTSPEEGESGTSTRFILSVGYNLSY